MIKKIQKKVVYIALFLLPLFTLPFTGNVLDFQKQFLLLGLVSVGIFFWIWDVLNAKKLTINLDPRHFVVLGFIVLMLVSSIFSLYSYGSLWGTPLPVAESFATILSFGLLYFLIVNNFKREEVFGLVATVTVSGAIAAVYAIIQAFGIYLLPFLAYSQTPSFNTVGTASSLALFSAIILAVVFPMMFFQQKTYRWLMVVCGGILSFSLLFFNGIVIASLPAKAGLAAYGLPLVPWIVLAVGALAAFLFSVSDQSFLARNSRAKNSSFALMFVALTFIAFNIFARDMVLNTYNSVFKAVHASTAIEAMLDQSTTSAITVSTLKQSAQTFFLGSGPGTFVYDYVKLKPSQISQDDLSWNVSFWSGASEFLNRTATTGFLGIIALLLVIVLWTIKGFRMLTEDEQHTELELAIFSGWLALVAAFFLYPFNFVLMMLFWVFLGAIMALNEEKLVELPIKSVKMSYAVSLVFVAILVLELGLVVWSSKRYYAEAKYQDAIVALQKKDLNAAITDLNAAANSTNRMQDNYLTSLSQIYLAKAQEELGKEGSDQQAALKAAAPYLKSAVDAAVLGTDIANPNNSANWAMRGFIYRQLIGVSEGFDTWALNTYQKALSLEPNNPELWTEIGQVYVLEKDLDKAKNSFNKAVALRPQYIDPHYYLALIADQQGEKEVAIKELQAIDQLLPDSDQTSKANIATAIKNLQEGKPLNGQPSAETPISNNETICQRENCHGLEIKCGSNPPDVCTEEYQIGDKCLQYAKCGIDNGTCQQISDPLFDACKSCVEKCQTDFADDENKLSACENKCK